MPAVFSWPLVPLQWGRGFKAAEKISVVAISWYLHALQWGRGFKAAEN